jgi:hypothetical protein
MMSLKNLGGRLDELQRMNAFSLVVFVFRHMLKDWLCMVWAATKMDLGGWLVAERIKRGSTSTSLWGCTACHCENHVLVSGSNDHTERNHQIFTYLFVKKVFGAAKFSVPFLNT